MELIFQPLSARGYVNLLVGIAKNQYVASQEWEFSGERSDLTGQHFWSIDQQKIQVVKLYSRNEDSSSKHEDFTLRKNGVLAEIFDVDFCDIVQGVSENGMSLNPS
jgi:hypothetical protein